MAWSLSTAPHQTGRTLTRPAAPRRALTVPARVAAWTVVVVLGAAILAAALLAR